jgi:hypothetical protein
MKKLGLAYSKNHFDPKALGGQSGAGFLAQSIYRILNTKYANSVIEYYDHTETNSIENNDNSPDLFIGISNNIHIFNKKLRPKQSVLFAVNYSAMRRRKITRMAKDFDFKPSFLTWEDGIYSNLNELEGVTAVVTLGNFSNYLSYVRSGVVPYRVFPITCSLGHNFEITREKRKKFGNDILYFPGGISFRKGAAYLRPIVDWIASERTGRILRIIGRATDNNLNNYIEEIMIEFPDNILWEKQWIERDSHTWKENISKSRLAVFPSLEEGIPASVLDLIEADIPVLYSSACGLDFVSRDVVPKSMKVHDWTDLLRSIILQNDEFLADLLADQKFMLENLPKDLSQLDRILDRIQFDSIWPSIEISNSLKLQIPKDSWLLKSVGSSEYRIYESDSINPVYPMNEIDFTEEMPINDLMAIAITQIDRYSQFAGLTFQHFNRFIVIERMSMNLEEKVHQTPQANTKFKLFTMVEKHKSFKWPRVYKIFILFKNQISASISYRSQKFLKNHHSKTQEF